MRMDEKHPRDTGCSYADKLLGEKSYCLYCPFPACVMDMSKESARRIINKERDKGILTSLNEGIKIREIMERFHVSHKTILRVKGE